MIAGGILVASDVVSYAQAQDDQQNGQWCAYFSNGITNCGFATLEQCLAEIKGKAGLCDRKLPSVQPIPRRRERQH
jgi:hypothetical protein